MGVGLSIEQYIPIVGNPEGEVLTPQDEIMGALTKAVMEFSCARWEARPREVLVRSLFPILNVGGMLHHYDWTGVKGDKAVIWELEGLAASAGRKIGPGKENDEGSLFSGTIRILKDNFNIVAHSTPKAVFCEAVKILKDGKTSRETDLARKQ